MNKPLLLSVSLVALLSLPGLNAKASLLTFDGFFGGTSYSFDGDGDGVADVVFTTTDPAGFRSAGPGPNMTYIHEPGLEGTALLPVDLRVDFSHGAAASLSFGFALDSAGPVGSDYPYADFKVYDSQGNLLASSHQDGHFTLTGMGYSSYPEGQISVGFSGLASYALFDFQSQYGRYIIDDFSGTFGSTEDPPEHVVPEPSTVVAGILLLLPMGGSVLRRLRSK
jgi:hypothetical protein